MKPILISACLLGVRCKYSGGDNYCPAAAALGETYPLLPVCPEQLGGLPTPRPPAEIRAGRVMNHLGEDVTEQYEKGAEEVLRLARQFGCTLAVLKARSPSCGCGAVYDGTFSGSLIPGDGVAAAALRRHGIRVITEESLENMTDFT